MAAFHAMRKAKPSTTLHLRLPPELKARVDEAAAASGRSLNSQIIRLVEQGLTVENLADADGEIRARMASIEASIATLLKLAPKTGKGKR